MLCPLCREELLVVEFRDVELDLCLTCQGIWFDADELAVLGALAGAPASIESSLAALPAQKAPRRLRCPRCDRRLREIEAPGRPDSVRIDRCARGDGIWFDRNELEAVLRGSLPEDAPGLLAVQDFLGRFANPKEK